MGLGFAIAGLVHKKDWKANRRAWHKMDKRKRLIIIISLIVLAAVIAAMIAMMIIRKTI
jgi:energy-coupling factor transporter transmembrane protein EcfT